MRSKTFGEFIRERRIEEELALREVAASIDFDQSLLSKVERNKLIAPPKIIKSLSKCLKVPYEELQIKYLSDKLFQELKHVDFSQEAIEIVSRRLEKEGQGTSFEMTRNKLYANIRNYLKGTKIEKAWVFGSFARKEESLDSDLDLLVRFKQPNDIDLFEYVGIKLELEDLTGRQVDLVEEGQELEKIKPIIEKEKVLIYES